VCVFSDTNGTEIFLSKMYGPYKLFIYFSDKYNWNHSIDLTQIVRGRVMSVIYAFSFVSFLDNNNYTKYLHYSYFDKSKATLNLSSLRFYMKLTKKYIKSFQISIYIQYILHIIILWDIKKVSNF
jgi:hypothetical protein